jgi:glutamyl-tRNA reductase
MYLVVVGLNHRTAPIALREKLSFSEHRIPEALRTFLSRSETAESAILSTCNRTELYAVLRQAGEESLLVQFLSQEHHLPEAEFVHHLYRHHDLEAVRHLFRVSAGLDSLVIGEPQILRQVRDAFAMAVECGATGTLLNALFRAAITTGKRARAETDIGRGGFSIGHAAVDLARSIFGSLKGATVLILGAGKMSELTAKHLVSHGTRFVLVTNRTHEKACLLASRLGGNAIRYEEFPEALAQADIVISSTASPVPIIHRETVLPVLRRRRGRPLFFIDIAVPRDIAPEVGDLDNVFLYDIDDLEEVVQEMARERAGEAQRVEAIIEEEVAKFMSWRRSLEAAPLVAGIRQKYEQIRQSELARLRRQHPDLPERAWRSIERATRSMMNRAARDPILRLKEAASQENREEGFDLIRAAREIFALPNGFLEPSAAEPTAELPDAPEEEAELASPGPAFPPLTLEEKPQ